MSFNYLKAGIVLRNHFDVIPLLVETVEKYSAAKSAVQVVDAITPAEYKIAAIVDDYNGVAALNLGDDNLDALKARICAEYNSIPPAEGVATTKKLLTADNLQRVITLISLLAPLLTKH